MTKIVSHPNIMSGTPVVEGTRVPADTVLAEVHAKIDKTEIYESYPKLPPDAIEACIAWEESGRPFVLATLDGVAIEISTGKGLADFVESALPMILFCDFDGVLHTVGGPVFEHADRLADLLREFQHVDIVLSTSWREIYPYEDLRHFLGADLAHRVIGKTPVITQKEPPYLPHVRYREILSWLQRHTREAKRGYVILDDEKVLFPPDCSELILCDPRTGLDDRVVEQLRARLSTHYE